ncbi:MAG: fibronectin/fibrinogen-binding protein [Ruminococcaceae bacterium]|nr:fibronectin/fibrinogen-binding protein [Oscillospiraceae bacterium]
MALDSVMIKIIADELHDSVLGSRIDRITMPRRDAVLLSLRNKHTQNKLFISARSGAARINLTEREFENPKTPPGFCMLLSKYLGSGRVSGIETIEGERIILFYIDAINEIGDRTRLTLSVELMGRYSNVVLASENNMIIDALKHIDSKDEDKRTILPGYPFTYPPKIDKTPLSGKTSEIVDKIREGKGTISKAVLDTILGIGPVVAREIAWRTDKFDGEAASMEEATVEKLAASVDEVKLAAMGKKRLLSIVYYEGRPMEYSFLPLTQYEDLEFAPFESVSELLDSYWKEREDEELKKARSHDLESKINALLEKVAKRKKVREEDFKDTSRSEELKLFGDLITSNIHNIEKGKESVKLYDYYNDRIIDIPLDPRMSPPQNAQNYYKRYRKLTNAAKVLAELINEDNEEQKYLESVKYYLENAVSVQEYAELREELENAGYFKKSSGKKISEKKSDFIYYRTSDGHHVTVGKNNKSNEKLTFDTARKSDYWFHVKGAPGSHVILTVKDGMPPDTVLSEAAMIAAYHSSQSGGELVPVDYTEVKNLKKIKGKRVGMVSYSNYKTAFVTPDKIIEEMRIDG